MPIKYMFHSTCLTAFKALLMIGETEPNFLPIILINHKNNFFSVAFLFDHLLESLHVCAVVSSTW